jgi:hypothetical protein
MQKDGTNGANASERNRRDRFLGLAAADAPTSKWMAYEFYINNSAPNKQALEMCVCNSSSSSSNIFSETLNSITNFKSIYLHFT